MSLEDTIRGLTDAVNALNATLQSARVDVPAPKEKAPKAAKAEAPTTTGASTVSSDSSATSESGPTTATPTTEVTYDMVANAITNTFPKDRAKVLAALAKFGAAKGPQLKPADYAAFLAELA